MELYTRDGSLGKVLEEKLKVRELIGGLKAERRGGVPFPVKSAKDLMIKLRKALDETNTHLFVVHQEAVNLPDSTDAKGNLITRVHVTTTVRFVGSDGTFVEGVGSGHGASNDDKAGGKASTYSWKDAVTKLFSIPDEDMVDTDDDAVPQLPQQKRTFRG